MKYIKFLFLSAILVTGFTSCDEQDSTDDAKGRIELSITDAPIYDDNVSGVYIGITGIEINGDDGWTQLETYEEPLTINLLDYQDGDVYFLTEEELHAGNYSEIRLLLEAPEMNGTPKSNPGTYLEFEDGSQQPLFVPSGATSGYKAKGDFDIPEGGVTSVTIDFDVRKSVVKAGNSGKYLLKPVLRLVENDNVALIRGEVLALEEYTNIQVYAYNDGVFTEEEIFDPESDEVDFPNAVTSAQVRSDGTFTLAFMEPGVYDLYAVAFDENGEYLEIITTWEDVILEAGEVEEVILEQLDEEEADSD